MLNEVKRFVEQVSQNCRVAIYGAGNAGCGLKKYIDEYRKDINIKFFVDAFQSGSKENITIISPEDLVNRKDEIDLIILATRVSSHEIIAVFEYLDIPYVYIDYTIQEYFRNEQFDVIQKINLSIFKDLEDKNLYNMLWRSRISRNYQDVAEYVLQKHNIGSRNLVRNYQANYMEFINRDAISTIIDCGFCNGIHSLSFKKNLKNLKKLYAFEPMYDEFKNDFYDKLIKDANFCEVVKKGLWEYSKDFIFANNIQNPPASRVIEKESALRSNEVAVPIKTISIDEFKEEKGIKKVDFIKMDIEGSELPALKGAIKTILSDRPQLAISIYHSYSDYVNIPKYLNSVLKDYTFKIGHYSYDVCETVLYAIPNELL